MLRIGELSRRLGVSDHLLRAWENRYGLLQPVRSPLLTARLSSLWLTMVTDVDTAAGRAFGGADRPGAERGRDALPSAADPARNPHRTGAGWTLGTVTTILRNPRYGLPAIIPIIMAANISRKCCQKGDIRTLRLTAPEVRRAVLACR